MDFLTSLGIVFGCVVVWIFCGALAYRIRNSFRPVLHDPFVYFVGWPIVVFIFILMQFFKLFLIVSGPSNKLR